MPPSTPAVLDREQDLNVTGTDVTSHVTSPLDRRRSERFEQNIDGWLSAPNGMSEPTGRKGRNGRGQNPGCQVWIRDLSLHGVGFVTEKPVQVDERRWIMIHRGTMRLSTRVRVVTVREAADGTFEVGGEFF
jgi:hypothetical protein